MNQLCFIVCFLVALYANLYQATEIQKVPLEWSHWSKCQNGKRYKERLQLQTFKEVVEACCKGDEDDYDEDKAIHGLVIL